MDKVLQILVVLVLLMLAINYYIKAEKTKFPLYRAAGRGLAPADLVWNLQGMDPDNHLLFIAINSEAATGAALPGARGAQADAGIEMNEGVVKVLDSNTGELLAHISVGADPGNQVFDPETRTLYSANGDGTLSVFRQVTPESYKIRQILTTRMGCRLMALDPRTKKIYLPVAGTLPETQRFEPAGDIPPDKESVFPGRLTGVECWIFSNA